MHYKDLPMYKMRNFNIFPGLLHSDNDNNNNSLQSSEAKIGIKSKYCNVKSKNSKYPQQKERFVTVVKINQSTTENDINIVRRKNSSKRKRYCRT